MAPKALQTGSWWTRWTRRGRGSLGLDIECQYVQNPIPSCLGNIATDSRHRDGKTPKDKVQQILNIIPIIPGQQGAPPPTPISQPINQPSQQAAQQSIPPQKLPPPQESHNLIDFDDPSAAHQKPQQPEVPPRNSSLPQTSGQPLHRQDTETSLVDEFVDADDGTNHDGSLI